MQSWAYGFASKKHDQQTVDGFASWMVFIVCENHIQFRKNRKDSE